MNFLCRDGPFLVSLFSSFLIKCTTGRQNVADVRIQTADLWCQKWLRYQLRHNHWPFNFGSEIVNGVRNCLSVLNILSQIISLFVSGHFLPHHRRCLVQVVRQIADALHPLDVQGGAGAEGDPKEGRAEGLPVLLRHLQVGFVWHPDVRFNQPSSSEESLNLELGLCNVIWPNLNTAWA